MKHDGVNFASVKSDKGELIKLEFKKYLRYWVWFALGVTLALLSAYMYLRYTPRVYKTAAKIQILNKGKGLELPSSSFVFNRSNINLENETEILKSYRIIEKVVQNLDLTMEYYDEGNLRTSEVYRFPFSIIKKRSNDSISSSASFVIEVKDNEFIITGPENSSPVKIANYNSYKIKHNLPFELLASNNTAMQKYVGKTYILKLLPVSTATMKLKGGISLSLVGKGSDLLQINYASESKEKSERIVNEIIAVFNSDGISDRQDVSLRTINFIDERFDLLARDLDSIEIEMKDFKQSNNLVDIASEAQVGLEQRTSTDLQVFDLETQLMLSDMLKNSLNTSVKNYELLPADIGLKNVNANTLLNEYNRLVQERNRFMISAGENNVSVQVINEQLNELKSSLNTSLRNYNSQLQASKKQYQNRNNKFVSRVASIPLKEKLLRSIERQQNIKETLYLFLLQKREEAAINLAIVEPSVKVVEDALSNKVPISPSSRNIYIFALAFGFIIPFGILYVSNLLDTKIKNKADIELKVDDIPILAELPKIESEDLIFRDPTDTTTQAEAFRILSSNVNYILSQKTSVGGKVIYCTSTIKGEGKTYTGVNLSLALSSINKKVLLIGADLRNPQIHNYTDHDKDEGGLTNFLYDDTFDWKNAIIKGFENHPNHDILQSGSIPPNPAQLLTNGRFEKLLVEAKSVYDYIIVDTAPTILVTDTMLISEYADATIYIVRANYTEKNLLGFSKNLHETGRLKNMAYVINGVGANRSYSYNYGYGYGYGSKD